MCKICNTEHLDIKRFGYVIISKIKKCSIKFYEKNTYSWQWGSGKTFLAKKLATILQCNLIHLDALYWHDGWRHTDIIQWQNSLRQAMQPEKWIMEGTPLKDLQLRIIHADIIIFLNINKYLCIWRLIKKGISNSINHKKNREDGCPVQGISWKAIKWVWCFSKVTKPKIIFYLSKSDNKTVFLNNQREVAEYLKNIDGKN